jgi:putative endonuclease
MLASRPQRTLCIGMTDDLLRRVWEHKATAVPGFTEKYDVDHLVWFEQHDMLERALLREKQMKGWRRSWKIRLLEKDNPHWVDLYSTLSP